MNTINCQTESVEPLNVIMSVTLSGDTQFGSFLHSWYSCNVILMMMMMAMAKVIETCW